MTLSFELVRWSDDRPRVATIPGTAEFDCFGLPNFVVPMLRSYESMSNLVKDCVSDFNLRIQFRQDCAQRNDLFSAPAGTESSYGTIELKCPVRQAVFDNQLFSKSFGAQKFHSYALWSDELTPTLIKCGAARGANSQ